MTNDLGSKPSTSAAVAEGVLSLEPGGEYFRQRHAEGLRQWKVFHAADDFVIEVYAETPSFPKDETYDLTSQMRRAVVSVPVNIVEGSAREAEREFLQFLNIAYASLAEVGYYIHLAKRLGYTPEDQATPLAAHNNELSRMLNGLMRSFQRHGSPAQDARLKTQDSLADRHRRPWSCDVAPGAATPPLELRRRPSSCDVAPRAAMSRLPSGHGRAGTTRPDIRRSLRANRTAARTHDRRNSRAGRRACDVALQKPASVLGAARAVEPRLP